MSDERTPESGFDGNGSDGTDHGGTAARREGPLYGVIAEFDTPGELIEAARKVRAAGYTEFDCYSPFPVHGIDDAMGIKRTLLPVAIFIGGAAGTVGGLLLQWWCNAYNWPWNISGKPSWSIPANIPIGFETTILLAVFTSFFGMWIANRLPQVWHPFFRNERFNHVTDDAFMLGIEQRDRRFDGEATPKLLKDAGAISVERVYYDPDKSVRVMPRWISAFIVASTAFALIPFAVAAKARTSHSTEPHFHIFPDMDFQPKYKSDQAMDLFGDGRENRGEITGTIARGSLDADDTFYRGIEHGADGDHWTTRFPAQLTVNDQLMRRGKNRFEIYCSPCHGYDGRGMGAIPQRVAATGGVWLARNLVDAGNPVAINMPNGQLFNTISNGYNTMMGYAAQIPHADRWAIVLYVRALQRSQNALLEDVPADHRSGMQMPEAPNQ
ncbi:MAG TPA: quinol:electron acceptor oxidoreductase subunit ActD [Kofleriaceae bacterium]|jgi:mono/diheme cytochrome c family protein